MNTKYKMISLTPKQAQFLEFQMRGVVELAETTDEVIQAAEVLKKIRGRKNEEVTTDE